MVSLGMIPRASLWLKMSELQLENMPLAVPIATIARLPPMLAASQQEGKGCY